MLLTFAPETLVGRRYLLQEELGKGGMGAVYRATDRLTGQAVALKRVLAPAEQLVFNSMSSSFDFRLSLAQEFKLLASLRHPHIISVLDYGFDDENQPFFIMELLEDAHTIIDAARGQPLESQIAMLVQVLQALAYLHQRGILHRDLKPANVLVGADGKVKVLDFGLSIAHGQSPAGYEIGTVGTITYMAPEVVQGQPASIASDLYAVGVIAYQVLSGEYPFQMDSMHTLLNEILTKPPDIESLQIPPQAKAVLARLLAKRPEDRYGSAREILAIYADLTRQPSMLETAAIRESFLQAAQFVGRESELAQLTEALNLSKQGRGSAWLVGGESGVGKSRLLDELRTQALVEGAFVLRGQATSERNVPYHIWREPIRWMSLQVPLSEFEASVLKSLVPDIGGLLEREIPDPPELDSLESQERLLGVVEDLFRRHQQPITIILEDLHWVGSESLKLLGRLSRALRNLPLLVIGSYRDDETPSLPQELPEMQPLKLQRLPVEEIARLSQSMLGEVGREQHIVELLQRETEGNIFFIVEVVRALAEEAGQLANIGYMTLPNRVFAGGMQRLIQRRLAHLPEDARPLLQVAAVAGRKLDRALLGWIGARAGGAYARDLDEWLTLCSNAAVLDVHDGEWRFAHDKLREALLMEIAPHLKRDLHQSVAEALETLYPNAPEHTAALAFHWSHAENKPKAIAYLDRAGEQAVASFANQEAISFLTEAAQLDTDEDPASLERHIHRAALLGQAYLGAGNLDESRVELQRALHLMKLDMPQGKRGLVWGLLRELAQQLIVHRSLPPRPTRDPKRHDHYLTAARMYERMAELFYFDNNTPATLYCSLRTLNLAEKAGPSPELARAYANITVATGLVGLDGLANRYSRKAKATAQSIEDLSTQARVLSRTALYHSGQGRWAEAQPALERSIEIAAQVGNQRQWGEGMGILVNVLYLTGHLARSKALCIELGAAGKRSNDVQHQAWGLFWGGQADLRLNHIEEANVQLETGLELVRTILGDSPVQVINFGLITLARYRKGDQSGAEEVAETALRLVEQLRSPTSFAQLEGFACLVEMYLSHWEEMKVLEAEKMPKIAQSMAALERFAKRFPIGLARAAYCRGWWAWLKDEPDQAREAWQKSLSYALVYHLPFDEGRALYRLGKHGEAGDPQREERLQRAIEIFTRLEAAYELAQARLAAQLAQ